MRIRTLIYFITTGFVVGIITLVVVQYITSNNVRELISGNESLLKEYKLSNGLVGLQKDLLLLDNKIKSAVTTGDSNKIKDFESGVAKIKEDVHGLEEASDSNTSLKYMNQLRLLVGQKITLSHQLVDSFYKAGKPTTESLFANNRAIKLSEEITRLTHKIDTSGRRALAQKVKTVDRSGQRVLNWNLYIIILVLFLLTAVFLIIVNRMKKQSELISQLNTSEKKLKEAALIKENFLANMSHEIRTPLNAILGYTHLLQKKKMDEDAKLHLTTVRQSGETLLSIVNDILDLSKIESGMMRVEKVPFSLQSLVHSIIMMFQHKLEEKNLMLTTVLEPDIPDILIGDSTRLTQILVNLVGNAIKFTPQGEIVLTIQARELDAEHVEIEFKVADSGIGIEPDKLETIFERFRQAEDATTRKFGGTGLGLSIVRDLVYLQGGQVKVKSKPGSGTTVVVTIPYKIPDHPVHFENSTPLVDLRTGVKILIVEDNLINQGLMSHLMQEMGIANKITNNGKEAIEILRKENFDLVFMDIQMPEMDGYEATREIRQSLKLNLPVIAMTAHAMAGEKEKCIRFGMDEHLAKPIREMDLQRIFTTFLSSAVSQKPTFVPDPELETGFKVIHLEYMQEISNGDQEYEKEVTEQFMSMIPVALASLHGALESRNYVEIRRIAHNLKSSISIMGLNALLDGDLDLLENGEPDDTQLRNKIETITASCMDALVEAGTFHGRL